MTRILIQFHYEGVGTYEAHDSTETEALEAFWAEVAEEGLPGITVPFSTTNAERRFVVAEPNIDTVAITEV